MPLPDAVVAGVPVVEDVETSMEAVAVGVVVPTTEEIIVIIIKTKINNNNKINSKFRNLTKEAQKPVRTSQLMPVLAIGRKAAKLRTVVTPWSAAGPT